MKHRLWLAFPFLLAAAPQDAPPAAPFARATLNVQQGGTRGADGVVNGGAYALVDSIDVPADHRIHDKLIALEGPGWESDKVAYRLYLDERNVPDIYGKRQPGRILTRIGMGKDDYHALADWGMDIFQVDQSLGMGGIGVLREGKATQLGKASITARVFNSSGLAGATVQNHGFPGTGGPADLATRYSIAAGSRVTHVEASVTSNAPEMVAGLTKHDGVTVLHSAATGKWRYFATYGVQSLAHDKLGIVLFYPAANAAGEGDDGQTLFVRFRDPAKIRYAFAAAWEEEPDAPKDLASFRRWLDRTVAQMGK